MRNIYNHSALLLLSLFALTACQHDSLISISNFSHNEMIHYPVPLLRGTLPIQADSITLLNKTTGQKVHGLIHHGKFILLPELVPGKNKLELRSGTERRMITLTYKPNTNSYRLKIFYVTDNTGITDYETPQIDDPQNFVAKISTGFKLLQTFIADDFNRKGLPRKTFNLEFDQNGELIIHKITSSKSRKWFHENPSFKWYGEIVSLMGKTKHPKDKILKIAFVNVTNFDKEQGKVVGDVSLNSKYGALFGSGSLYTWPDNLQDVFRAFSDSASINPSAQCDNSYNRWTHGAMASTSLGEILHEIGHGTGLPNSTLNMSIMGNGYNYFSRSFTHVEAPEKSQETTLEFQTGDLPFWSSAYADILWHDHFFNPEKKKPQKKNLPAIHLNDAKDSVLIATEYGIRGMILYNFNNGNLQFREEDATIYKDSKPQRIALAVKNIQKQVNNPLFTVLAYDEFGNKNSLHVWSEQMLQP